MKKIVTLILLIAFVSCKTETNTPYTGDFVYYADAAVFQTGNDIYGVVLNENAKTISKQAKAFQKEPTDMVKVEVLGELIPKEKNEEGWPFKLKINKIINVSALDANKNNVIKLGN